MLQENIQLSNDRLLRVREDQPSHLYSGSPIDVQNTSYVINGDLCIFKRIDCDKVLIGRVVQFSYIKGNKKARAYSSSYVDMNKLSYKTIGVFANWYAMVETINNENILFQAVDDAFTAGYLSMENYLCTLTGDIMTLKNPHFPYLK